MMLPFSYHYRSSTWPGMASRRRRRAMRKE
jgi:hypothetical protein